MKRTSWVTVLLVLVGILLGAMLTHYTAGIKGLSWLAFGMDFGTQTPFTLDLGIISLTLGGRITLTVSTVLCTAVSLIVGKFIIRK